jgi:hypothetical protein
LNLFAVEHIRAMRGGSQSHLMRCSNGEYYVVKFKNNPQGTRTLTNELLGALLAARLGLPVAEPSVIEVDHDLIKLSEEMTVKFPKTCMPCTSGLSFGSRYASIRAGVQDIGTDIVFDFLPPNHLRRVTNLCDFMGMLVFDLWTGNTDNRQTVFVRKADEGAWTVVMIDNGWCFASDSWDFRDRRGAGLYYPSMVYESVTGIEDFNPWLSRLEREIDMTVLKHVADEVPSEWYEKDAEALNRLLTTLNERRVVVRELLWETWERSRRAFPGWIERPGQMHAAAGRG